MFLLADGYNSVPAFCTKFDIDEWKNDFDPENIDNLMWIPTSILKDITDNSNVQAPTDPKEEDTEVVTEIPEHLDDPFDLFGTPADQKDPL